MAKGAPRKHEIQGFAGWQRGPRGSPSSPKAMQSKDFVLRTFALRIRKEKVRFFLQGAFGGSGGLFKCSSDDSSSSPKAMKSKDLLVGKGGPDGSPSSPTAMKSKDFFVKGLLR